MSEFSELIKNFDKVRQYMRDFYIYGFKVRGEYTYKSARTYDNERRRMESWLNRYVRWDYSQKGKRVFLSVDSARVPQNPLYAVWKSKSFTKSDIMLHFFLLDLLRTGEAFTADQLTDAIASRYQVVIDAQTVRGKLREYEAQGILTSEKRGRSLFYGLSPCRLEGHPWFGRLLDGIKFFQEVAPFGFVGSTILDNAQAENDLFGFKHHFIIHTLEDGILLELLEAMEQQKSVCLENESRRTGRLTLLRGVPLKILVSVQTGRRYLCLYNLSDRRFTSIRLDSITAVAPEDPVDNLPLLQRKLEQNLPRCWGVSFGGKQHIHQLFLKLRIDEEREYYLFERLLREGRGGEVLRVERDTFLYSITLFDANEASSWIKTFTGRILALECTDPTVTEKFYRDMDRLYAMYFTEEDR